MKRIIKFRVWNGLKMEHNVMAGFLGAFYVQGIDEKDSASMSQFNTKYHETTPLMQFTGLVDKKGIDVYEGDIIKWKTTRFHTKEQELKGVAMPKFFVSPVLWADGEFLVNESNEVYVDVNGYDTPLCCFFSDSMDNKFDFKAEVIGNIYENPELITHTRPEFPKDRS
jgi:uncharacterized phage protein (TIGR01671 family)